MAKLPPLRSAMLLGDKLLLTVASPKGLDLFKPPGPCKNAWAAKSCALLIGTGGVSESVARNSRWLCANLQSGTSQRPRVLILRHMAVFFQLGACLSSSLPCAYLQRRRVQMPCIQKLHNFVLNGTSSKPSDASFCGDVRVAETGGGEAGVPAAVAAGAGAVAAGAKGTCWSAECLTQSGSTRMVSEENCGSSCSTVGIMGCDQAVGIFCSKLGCRNQGSLSCLRHEASTCSGN